MTMLKKLKKHAILGAMIGACVGLFSSVAQAAYPEREVRYIVPWSPGGVSDAIARIVAAEAAKEGMTIIVEHAPGASGTIGLAKLAAAKPDGYTIGSATSSQLAMVAQGLTKTKNDEFTYLNLTSVEYFVLAVPGTSSFDSIKGFMEHAKKRDGKLSIGTAGSNNIPHILAANTAAAAGTPYIHTPYPGATKALTDLAGGQIDAVIAKPSESRALIEAGKIKAIALYADKRVGMLPNTPTFAEHGLNMFPQGPLTQMSWLAGPAGMPADVTNKLISVFEKAVQSPAFKEYAENGGFSALNVKGAELRKQVDAVQATMDRVAPQLFKAKPAN
ncbi:tripartite tricarboxylate transporter substrate binding protein [Imbroritus primus]|uniref:Tripartite tricarboxylate transporter substrate binding protein n=1 Tax=Imbroritus primus TaxID=3058603 RepID=A0ACD3SKJ9_9BURK|nr:tripartite tricarboxylate transporter substrate binding protein [Burkholderiaceae bacterium PBA]